MCPSVLVDSNASKEFLKYIFRLANAQLSSQDFKPSFSSNTYTLLSLPRILISMKFRYQCVKPDRMFVITVVCILLLNAVNPC